MCENNSHPPHAPRAGFLVGVTRTLVAASLLALASTGCVANPTPHPEKPSYGGIDAPADGAENRGGSWASDKATGGDQSDDMFAGESPAPADPSIDTDGDGFSNAGSWSPPAMPEPEPEHDRIERGSIWSDKQPLSDDDDPRVVPMDDDDSGLAG